MTEVTGEPSHGVWVHGEGQRFGLLQCPTCRASIVVDSTGEDDSYVKHREWHKALGAETEKFGVDA